MLVHRRILTVALAIVATGWGTPALAASPAADFANSGTAVISVDQVMPIVAYSSTTITSGGIKTTNSATSISLVTAGVGNTTSAISFKMLPRLAFDYIVGPGITVGGSAWVFTNLSASQDVSPSGGGATVSTDQPKATYWGFAPRIGYAVAVGEILALWPRLGVEYGDVEIGTVSQSGITSGGGSVNQLALDLDGLLVITPIHHFGIALGPTAAIPLTGKTNTNTSVNGGTNTSTSSDISMWYVALTLNVLGYF
jgi:hypothetical protein